MQNGIKTKKIEKGHYQFTHNGEVFEIVNNEGLLGFTWHCRHAESRKATECLPSKSYLTMELLRFLLDDFFNGQNYWPIQVDEYGLF